ncbi:signal peptidase I [Nocardioides sp.]|uniref:signal peptidase I n=1 Tax=Nocardioides sp. TaxID=35761 RepID=UPI002B7F9554|nr:signal peptidase I [Nocardioides sp.]HSX66163.1 signal peptidase I [Nocardioides sp.]
MTQLRTLRGAVTRLLGWFGRAALLLGLALGLVLVVPALLGFDRYVITGGSMTGTVDKYAVAFEREVSVDELVVGDVITYLPPADSGTHSLVTHRIISIGTSPEGHRVLRTQGDANPDPDPWRFELVQPTVNRMSFHVPYVGWPLIALADPEKRRLLLGGPAVIIGLLAAIELAGAVRRSPGREETDARSAARTPHLT